MSSTHHPSTLALDAVAFDALPADARTRLQAHVAICTTCRARVREAQRLAEQLPPYVMARTLVAVGHRERWWRLTCSLKLAIAPVMLAATVLVLVLRLRGGSVPGDDGLAVKGGPALQIYALREHQVFEVVDGTTLVAGDEIRFAVTPAGATHVLIASVDGGDHVTIYVPYGGAQSRTVNPQGRTELPGSIVLDDAPGPERVVAMFSVAPLRAEDVEAELHKLAAAGPGNVREPNALAIPATQISVVFEKAPGLP